MAPFPSIKNKDANLAVIGLHTSVGKPSVKNNKGGCRWQRGTAAHNSSAGKHSHSGALSATKARQTGWTPCDTAHLGRVVPSAREKEAESPCGSNRPTNRSAARPGTTLPRCDVCGCVTWCSPPYPLSGLISPLCSNRFSRPSIHRGATSYAAAVVAAAGGCRCRIRQAGSRPVCLSVCQSGCRLAV